MSWFPVSDGPSWLRRVCTSVVKSGPVPRHVAFIMDGNRRFAVKKSIERAAGHLKGFDKLAETLEWCRDLGITEVTVYAFSIENFKRPKEEVDCLMEIARQKFARLMEESEMLTKHGIQVRVIGDTTLLPHDIQQLVAKVMAMTRHNSKATLNVCFAYTSRHEICDAIKLCARGVEQGIIEPSDISADVLEHCLYTRSSHPDLLVRTSGEVRLSDFLLIQSSFSVLSFVRVLWPEFSIWHLYAAVLHYQANCDAVQKFKNDVARDRLAQAVKCNSGGRGNISRGSESHDAPTDTQLNRERLARLARFSEFIRLDEKPLEEVENIGTTQTILSPAS